MGVIDDLETFVSEIGTIGMVSATLIAGVVATLLAYLISSPISGVISKYSDELDKEQTIKLIRPPITFTTFSIGLWGSIQFISALNPILPVLRSLLLTLFVILWVRFIYFLGREIIEDIIAYRYDENLVPIIKNVWTLLSMLVAVILIFESWNVDITPILASAGVFGIVIGLAARETISNFFGSIALYADNTYQKGDYIRIENSKAEGFVEKISIRSTQLKTLENNTITIPNSELHKSIIENRSEPTKSHRIEIEVAVSYDIRPEDARDVIEDTMDGFASDDNENISESIDNYKVLTKNLADSGIVYRIFIWIEYPYQQPAIRDRVQEKLYDRLDEENMNIPFPQRTVHMQDSKESSDEPTVEDKTRSDKDDG
jgi:small-conductance mechanosensitive channel